MGGPLHQSHRFNPRGWPERSQVHLLCKECILHREPLLFVCTGCQQCQQCKQLTARCYFHLWWYFCCCCWYDVQVIILRKCFLDFIDWMQWNSLQTCYDRRNLKRILFVLINIILLSSRKKCNFAGTDINRHSSVLARHPECSGNIEKYFKSFRRQFSE